MCPSILQKHCHKSKYQSENNKKEYRAVGWNTFANYKCVCDALHLFLIDNNTRNDINHLNYY